MAIRNLPNTDELPACEVDTAEELTQLLIPGVYVQPAQPVWCEKAAEARSVLVESLKKLLGP